MKRLLTMVLILAAVLCFASCGREKADTELQMKGTYYDNVKWFKGVDEDQQNSEPVSAFVGAYLQSIEYEILEMDKKNMVATVEVSVPDLIGIMSQTIERIVAENEGRTVDDLLVLVQDELEQVILDKKNDRTVSQITLGMEEADGTYVLIYNEQWSELLFGSIEEAFAETVRKLLGGEGYEQMD